MNVTIVKTAKELEEFVKGLSYFIKEVKFTKAENNNVEFEVTVGWFYKLVFGRRLLKQLDKN